MGFAVWLTGRQEPVVPRRGVETISSISILHPSNTTSHNFHSPSLKLPSFNHLQTNNSQNYLFRVAT
jgi:hypothetical protein